MRKLKYHGDELYEMECIGVADGIEKELNDLALVEDIIERFVPPVAKVDVVQQFAFKRKIPLTEAEKLFDDLYPALHDYTMVGGMIHHADQQEVR